MAAASTTSSSELPECPVCHDGYKEPKILPCTHLACKKCVVSWLQKAGVKGGCPLCRAPILPSTSRGQRDLDTLVNDLPTDLATMALVDSHNVLSGQHVCMLCDNNSAATSFCLQCDVKICNACIKVHKNIPLTRKHIIEDLNKLSPQRLAEINRATCNVHDDRPAEVYCSTHQELICMLCATTNHRSCAEVKTTPDVATEKRRELEQQAQRLRDRATALATEIQEVADSFRIMRKKANDTFDDLEQCLKKRRQEVNELIQAEEDAVMTSLAELEKWRAALALNAASVGNVVQSASGGSLLGMMKGLKSRLNDLESQTGTTRKMEVKDLTLNLQKLDQLRADIASLGQITKPVTTTKILQQPTQPLPATSTATSATTPRTADKPRKTARPFTDQCGVPPGAQQSPRPMGPGVGHPPATMGAPSAQAYYKFTPNMRKPPANVQGGVGMPQAPPQSLTISGQEPLTATMLAGAPPQEQKQMLGERLFPLIQRMYPDLAGKITGMLLEIDNWELLHMLESQESLKAKVEEALAVLRAHQAKEAASPKDK